MNIFFKKYLLIILIFFSFFCNFNNVNAALVNCGRSANDPCTVDDLFGSSTGTGPIWINLIQTTLGISGIIILCIFIYAGFRLMISGGEKTKIGKAKEMMIGSFVGILLVFFSFTIVKTGLIVLVGNKWSIYFGNSEISNTPATNNNVVGGCVGDSSCRPTEYCCVGDRYDPTGTKCTLSGRCLSKKLSSTSTFCIDTSECKSGTCVSGPYGSKLCGCTVDSDCKNTNTDYCCNSNLTSAGFTCSISNVCNTVHFQSVPVTKIQVSGVTIENNKYCGSNNSGRCMYIKKSIIDSSYYLASWNVVDTICGRDANRCTDGGNICLRCVEKSVYERIK